MKLLLDTCAFLWIIRKKPQANQMVILTPAPLITQYPVMTRW